jgi:hypothetical protein
MRTSAAFVGRLHYVPAKRSRKASLDNQSVTSLLRHSVTKLREAIRGFKDNGSPVELGLFRSPAYKEISAVIFNGCATIGKVRALCSDPSDGIVFTALRLNPKSDQPHVIRQPKRLYQENLVDGLRIYHNPFATYPVDPALFRHPSVFQIYHDSKDEIHVEEREGLLLYRSVSTALPRGTLSGQPQL